MSSWLSDYCRGIDEHIRRHGRAVQGVFDSSGRSNGFAYTIGNFRAELPEFFIAGLPMEVSQHLLNDLSDGVANGSFPPPEHGRVLDDLVADYPCVLVRVEPDPEDDYLNMLQAYCAQAQIPLPPVYQVVWPDKDGSFPWSTSATTDYLRFQPLLGPAPQAN